MTWQALSARGHKNLMKTFPASLHRPSDRHCPQKGKLQIVIRRHSLKLPLSPSTHTSALISTTEWIVRGATKIKEKKFRSLSVSVDEAKVRSEGRGSDFTLLIYCCKNIHPEKREVLAVSTLKVI